MRKWMLFIMESYDEDYPEDSVLIYDRPNTYCGKGEVREMLTLNLKTHKEKIVAKVIGLGYADFKNEKDFKEKLPSVVRKKLTEVDLIEEAEKIGEKND